MLIFHTFVLGQEKYFTDFKRVAIKSPEVSVFQKHTYYPMDLQTGKSNIFIPLHDIQVGWLNLPISLNYHTGGIKVTEKASQIGLGWVLEAGGVITRSKNGGNDLLKKGYPSVRFSIPSISDVNYPIPGVDFYFKYLFGAEYPAKDINRMNDLEPDMFTYSFKGTSGVFYLIDSVQCLQKNASAIKIKKQNNNFIIQDDEGTNYYFDIRETVSSTGGKRVVSGNRISFQSNSNGQFDGWDIVHSTDEQQPMFDDNVVSEDAWYLTKIISANLKDTILLEYGYENYSVINERTGQSCEFLYYSTRPEINRNVVIEESFTTSNFSKPYLMGIKAGGERMEMIYVVNDRLDVNVSKRRLAKIKVYNQYNLCYKQVVLSNNVYFNAADGDDKRMKLAGVNFENPETNLVENSYKFSYFENDLPSLNSNAQDYWGYHNGQPNGDLIPKLRYSIGSGNMLFIGSADRTARQDKMLAFSLNTIEFPNGAMHRYIFSGNYGKKYNSDQVVLVGGLKIDEIFIYPNKMDLNVYYRRKYTYKFNGVSDIGKIHGNIGAENSLSFSQDLLSAYGNTRNFYLKINSLPNYNFQAENVPILEYDEVIVEDFDNLNLQNGKIVSKFSRIGDPITFSPSQLPSEVKEGYLFHLNQLVDMSYPEVTLNTMNNRYIPSKIFYPVSSKQVLIEELQYDNKNNLIAETKNEYVNSSFTNVVKGFSVSAISTYFSKPGLVDPIDYYPERYSYFLYEIPIGDRLLKKTVKRDFFSNGTVQRDFSYSYIDSVGLVKQIIESGSTSQPNVIDIFYPKNFNTGVTPWLGTLQINNFWQPLRVTKKIGDLLIHGEVYEYDSLLQLKAVYRSSTNSPSNFDAQVFLPSDYRLEDAMLYDRGRLVQYQHLKKAPTSYLWGYQYGMPIAHLQGLPFSVLKGAMDIDAINAKNSTREYVSNKIKHMYLLAPLAVGQLNGYEYEPQIGVTKHFTPSGQVFLYAYDGLGRLNAELNEKSELFKTYTYNYGGTVVSLPIVPYYYNVERRQSFTKNDCSNGQMGGSVDYVVPRAIYFSTVSQASVDSMANLDILENGQNYANRLGTCNQSNVLVPVTVDVETSNPPYSIDFKLVNSATGNQYTCTSIMGNIGCTLSVPQGNYTIVYNASNTLPMVFKFVILINGIEYEGGRASQNTTFYQNVSVSASNPLKLHIFSKYDRLGN
ncbi:DUF5977 domain-containing protein [Sphingobacterium cellulitidis]|uniref:DUF5977 domain-containing protein n=1 Tax=Sphingobacterium cellulitidis TaxID=1768011 RepID=A0A8H9FZF5_9SPHI|nr:DUF5977 domain-containing protein [Sphingobacterium soli]MBA8986124.1 hypothetical protein [Sphingobacterium soli]GGE17821.1 hypothetical protein GCM10011516_14370 [Sphingobacterium soli]